MTDINQKIIDWATERGIFEKATPLDQYLKSAEELGELCAAINKGNIEAAKLELGDFLVTLILYARMNGIELALKSSRISQEYKSKDVLPVVIARFADNTPGIFGVTNLKIKFLIDELASLCFTLGTTQEECLTLAYDKIKSRTGKMVDGVFVKEGDCND